MARALIVARDATGVSPITIANALSMAQAACLSGAASRKKRCAGRCEQVAIDKDEKKAASRKCNAMRTGRNFRIGFHDVTKATGRFTKERAFKFL